MQHTRLADGYTTRGTKVRGYWLGREFALLHSDRMRFEAVANLYNFAQYLPLVAKTQLRSTNWHVYRMAVRFCYLRKMYLVASRARPSVNQR
jgi:hypothetical protein